VWGGLLVGCLALGTMTAAGSAPNGQVRVLQMNLCNSGLAGCYTGLAVATALEVIHAQAPDVVTLNEVCRGDIAVIERGFGAAAAAFRPAIDRRTGEAVRCVDGEQYGIAVLTRRPATLTTGGIYPTQDPVGPEQRAWLCVDATDYTTCTTHLDNGNTAVARAQCDYLLGTALPSMRARGWPASAVLGGDFNLRADVQSCLASGDRRIDDGGVQNVVVTSAFAITSQRLLDMRDTTDHPGLLVTLASR
jgi:Endonuclease/Exonuclease/phosphatase family